MPTIQLVDHCNAHGQDAFTVKVEGVAYRYEVWATENASGADWYDVDTHASITSPLDGRSQPRFQRMIDRYTDAYYTRWSASVQPAIDSITRITIAEINKRK